MRENATTTISCDVAVAGLGASGLMAAYGAAKAGARVVAIDAAPSMAGTTNMRTSAAFAVGSSLQQSSPEPLGIEEYMAWINKGTNYQSNQKAMRAIIEASGRAIDAFVEAGMPFDVDFERTDSNTPMMVRGGHLYGFNGPERAEAFSRLAESVGVQCIFNTALTGLIYDENGIMAGILCDGEASRIEAGAVIIATGGFLGSPEEVAKRFAGASIVCGGNPLCKGAGINAAIEAGAQIGKCFSISMNEYGGANPKASPSYSYRPGYNTNEALRLPIFGGLLVDAQGERFVDEGVMCERTMFCCEPMLRSSCSYAICDEAFMRRWESEPVAHFMGDARMQGMFAEFFASDIREQFAKAVEEGWAFSASSIEEIAERFELPRLPQTVAEYNECCADGRDTLFFKDAKYLAAVAEPPFYCVQSSPCGWLSLGGIRCNGNMQALDSNGKPIPALFVAGSDADIFTSPYYAPGSANGFAIGSGLIAGETAAKNVLGLS